MHCRWLCRDGRALRRGLGAVFVVCISFVLAACKPQFGSFLPANAHFSRTFGQLFVDGTERKISHYVIVKMPPAVIRTVSSGTMEYVPNFNEMGNCVLVRPQTYPVSLNDFSNLHALPSPSAIILAYCHLDQVTVHEAARTQYMRTLPQESASDWIDAANHFIARDEGFLQIDIRNIESPFPVSDEIGRAINDELYFAAFKDEGNGVALFVNPLPYLAAAVPALSIDAVAPTIADIVVQTSKSGFRSNDIVEHPVVGGSISAPLPRHPMRVAIRSIERTAAAGPVTVPYAFRSRLELVSGTPLVRSRGAALFNSFTFQQRTDLVGSAFETAKSDPSTEEYFPVVAWNPTQPAPSPGEEFFNALTIPGSFSLDLNSVAGGAAAFPGGQYRLTVTVADVGQAAMEQTISFQLEPGLEMQILTDGNPDDQNFQQGDTPVDFVRIGLWDHAFDPSDHVMNAADPANFVARDRFRFYVRIRDPNANTNSDQEVITARLGTFEDRSGLVVDNLTEIDLIESASEPGVFVSRAQLLTTTQIDLNATSCAPNAVQCEDDLFQAHDGRQTGGGLVADDAPGDRTHQAGIEDHVRIEYHPVGAVHDQAWDIPVCRRNPDQRRKVLVRMTVFDHIEDETKVQEEFRRANLGWAPACLRVDQEGTTRFLAGPLDANGDNIIADNEFTLIKPANPQGASDERVVITAFRNQAPPDVVEVFVVPEFDESIKGTTDIPADANLTGLGEKIFVFMEAGVLEGQRTLAHELGHALENGGRDEQQTHWREFYPVHDPFTDERIHFNRRISWQTIQLTTQVRTSSSGTGNRLMKPLQ